MDNKDGHGGAGGIGNPVKKRWMTTWDIGLSPLIQETQGYGE